MTNYRIDVSTDEPRRGPGRPKKTETSKNSATQDRRISSTIRGRKGLAEKGASPSDKGIQKRANSLTYSGEAKASDDEYTPSEDDEVIEGDDDADGNLETAALAWGLLSIGGLGSGSAAVYGAEATLR